MTDLEAAVWMRRTFCLEETRDGTGAVIRVAGSRRTELTSSQTARLARLLNDLLVDAAPDSAPVFIDHDNEED